jgi:toxin YoeB
MEIELTQDAQDDLAYWKKTQNEKVLIRIRALLESISETPYSGIGKPEALKYILSGKWSRRIDQKNRIVYQLKGDIVYIQSLKGHYSDK